MAALLEELDLPALDTLLQDASRFDAMECSEWAPLGGDILEDAFGAGGAAAQCCGPAPPRQALSHDSANRGGGGGGTAAVSSAAAGQEMMTTWGVSYPSAGTPERSSGHSDDESAHAASLAAARSRPVSPAAGPGAPPASQEHSSGSRAACDSRVSPVRSDGSVLYSDRQADQAIGRSDRGADQNEGLKGTLALASELFSLRNTCPLLTSVLQQDRAPFAV